MKVSVVIPAFNEEPTLPWLRARLTAVAAMLPEYDFEFLLVDDHSADATPRLLEAWTQADPRVRGLRLARNCGSHAAVTAGLVHCTGDCAVVMAADLQDPPELLAELLRQWRAGFEVVWAVRSGRRGVSWAGRVCSHLYWATMRRIALAETPRQGADVVLLDRKVIDAVGVIGEKNTSLLSLLVWLGFRQTHIPYVKVERVAGRSGWTFAKRLKLAIDSVVSFSTLPIRLTWLCGLLFLGGAVLWTTVAVAGWARVGAVNALIVGLLLLGFGVLLTFLGAVGEYVWRAYDEVRGRPRYLVERVFGPPASRFVAAAEPQEVAVDAKRPVSGLESAVPPARSRDHAGVAAGVRELHVHAGADG
jgi:dolichol-phosphate mannosyltransferase